MVLMAQKMSCAEAKLGNSIVSFDTTIHAPRLSLKVAFVGALVKHVEESGIKQEYLKGLKAIPAATTITVAVYSDQSLKTTFKRS